MEVGQAESAPNGGEEGQTMLRFKSDELSKPAVQEDTVGPRGQLKKD